MYCKYMVLKIYSLSDLMARLSVQLDSTSCFAPDYFSRNAMLKTNQNHHIIYIIRAHVFKNKQLFLKRVCVKINCHIVLKDAFHRQKSKVQFLILSYDINTSILNYFKKKLSKSVVLIDERGSYLLSINIYERGSVKLVDKFFENWFVCINVQTGGRDEW